MFCRTVLLYQMIWNCFGREEPHRKGSELFLSGRLLTWATPPVSAFGFSFDHRPRNRGGGAGRLPAGTIVGCPSRLPGVSVISSRRIRQTCQGKVFLVRGADHRIENVPVLAFDPGAASIIKSNCG